MTVSTTPPRNDYVGNGATDTYSYTFRIFAATDLRVTTRDTVGVETALTYPTDYTVTGVNQAVGGTIVLTAGNLTSGYALTIRFDRAPRQSTDLRNQGSFFPQTHEDKFDELTRYSQQIEDELDRSLKLPETEAGTSAATTLPVAADRASRFLGFDGSGNPIAATVVTDVPVSAFMETVLDDVDGSAGIETILDSATAETAPASGDLLPMSDVSANAGRKMTLGNVLKVVNDLTEDTAPDTGADFLLTYDVSASAAKKAKLVNVIPPGIMATYGGSTAPTGWLECDGSAVSRSTYAALFAAISTTWGAGDGSTTFNLPASAGRGLIGKGTGTVVASGVDGDVDLGGDTFTVTANNTKWITGMAVAFTLSSGTITGLTSGNTYYIIRSSSTLIQLASSLANAQNGTAINMTAKSSPVWTLTHTYTPRTLGEYGGEESHAMSLTELLAHTHVQSYKNANGTFTGPGAAGWDGVSTTNTQSTGGNQAMNIMGPNLVVMVIIKT